LTRTPKQGTLELVLVRLKDANGEKKVVEVVEGAPYRADQDYIIDAIGYGTVDQPVWIEESWLDSEPDTKWLEWPD
jgi:hypothetical protein